MSAGNLYEIRCDHCDVSFPPGTKRCLHCQGRLGGGLTQAPPVPTMRGQASEQAGSPVESLQDLLRRQQPLHRELSDVAPSDPNSQDESEKSPVRTAVRLGVNFLWILGAILITALQMCRGG